METFYAKFFEWDGNDWKPVAQPEAYKYDGEPPEVLPLNQLINGKMQIKEFRLDDKIPGTESTYAYRYWYH